MSNDFDLSDWEVVQPGTSNSQPIKGDLSDWEAVPKNKPQEQEGFGKAALMAVPRILNDLGESAYAGIQKTPEYWQKYKTELPGFWKNLFSHPLSMGMQGLAGANEAINSLNHIPVNAAKYGSERLNLVPKEAPNFLNKITPDTSEAINELFGQPKYPGEALARGTLRNLPNTIPAVKTAQALNPLKLTARQIEKNVIKEEANQVGKHNILYNKIWNEAEKTGFNHVPVNEHQLSKNLSVIEKYKTPKEFESLEDFIIHPTLENAQKAQSQMNRIHNTLREKSKRGSLEPYEKDIYNASKDAEKHIEENMFKNEHGELNKELQEKYKHVTKSYRENVVPYKYNQSIQAAKDEKILSSELANALSHGEFARKKGFKHPEIWIRNNLGKLSAGAGTVGGVGWLLEHLFGNPSQNRK